MVNMMIGNILFIVTVFVCSVNAEVSFITKCVSTDSSCVKRSAQAALPFIAAGIPEMKVQPLDPLRIDRIDASSPQLKLTSTDVVITGLKDCVIEHLERNIETSKIIVDVLCDVDYKGQYEIHGQVLIVPFEGKGDIHVVLRKLFIHTESDMTVKVDKKGQKHWFITNYKYRYEQKGKTDLELENLFEGNEILGRAARDLLKTSGKEIVTEVGPPILKSIVEKIIKTINQFYRAVAPEDLALDSFKED